MKQSLSEIRQLLQQKIFTQAASLSFNSYSKAVLKKLSLCHTNGIGRHHYLCNNKNCNFLHYQYHSCGNRHCMNCGALKKEQWVQDRIGELLPTSYFHMVFTLPQELRSLCMSNRKIMFKLLFDASHYTITKLAANKKWLGAQPGITSILHTNGQDLCFHPHIHAIVTGGGINTKGKWINEKRKNGKFLFPNTLVEKIYKAYFLKQLHLLFLKQQLKIDSEYDFLNLLQNLKQKIWNVYSKAPFGGPEQIVAYLGRYTHKCAITAHRITSITNDTISFYYKDYKDDNKTKLMTLSHQEFLRRFEQHILPKGFVKIRHAGFLSSKNKMQRINNILLQLQLPAAKPKIKIPTTLLLLIKTGEDITCCPKCSKGKMIRIASFININGRLVNIEDFKNKGSPKIKIKAL